MAGKAPLALTLALLGLLEVPPARAQAPATLPAPPTPAPEAGWEPEMLRLMPQPPDQPRSLYQPAPPLGPPPPDLERPYFQPDPILDPPWWPQPGWFSDVQIGLVHPHVFSEMTNNVVTDLGRSVKVALGNAPLDWTVAPRFTVGYRLPSGFGAFSISERFFNSQGTATIRGPDGRATQSSRLSVNYTDFDYTSREYTPVANWNMQWLAGVRVAETYISTLVDQPFAQAAAGNAIASARQTNNTVGAGVHYGLQFERPFVRSGFSFLANLDVADTFVRLHQNFAAQTTTPTPSGRLDRGVEHLATFQQVPIFLFQVGLSWQPPQYRNLRFFVGYLDDTWWNVEKNRNTSSKGFFDNQGIVFQAGLNY